MSKVRTHRVVAIVAKIRALSSQAQKSETVMVSLFKMKC